MSVLHLGELTALSHNYSERMLNDTYYNKHVLLEAMRRTKKTYPGGLHIQVELGVAGDDTDQTGGAISPTGSWDYTNPELFDAATFLPKLEVQVIVVWDIEVSRNGTAETQYLDLIKERQAWYMKIMADRKSRYLYGRGGAIRPNGLENIFDNTSEFGNIDRTDARAAGYRSFVFPSDDGNTRNITRRLLANAMTAVTDNNIRPDIGITTPGIRDDIELILTQAERFPNTALAQAGFDSVTYRGIPIVFDKEMPLPGANRHNFFWLNFDYLRDYCDERFNMQRHPWQRMPNNPGQYEVIINIGNVVSPNLRYLSKISDLKAGEAGVTD